jgi:hypothetical protein
MESLKNYCLNIPEQEYHDYPAWSYSTIAKYARNGFSSIATLHEKMKPTPEMEFGSLFDSILTKGKKTLDDYAVVDFNVPEAERKVLDALLTKFSVPFEEISMNDFLGTADSVSYQMKWKPDTRYQKVAAYSGYYNMLRSGKKVVSQKDWDDAVEMARIFRTDPYLKNLFGTKNTEEVEYIYQPQFFSEWETEHHGTVIIKCMFDLLVVNHKDKTIQPVDLKTSSMPAYDFPDHFVKMRYDIQGDLYTAILTQVVDSIPEYRDYTILPYLYTDISRADMVPVTYEYDTTMGLSFTKGEKTYTYKRWNELLEEILEYEESHAVVPSYISVKGPNDLIEILSR